MSCEFKWSESEDKTMALAVGAAITRARAVATDSEVWAILRFDRNNTRLEVFWSERNVAGGQIPDGEGGMRNYGTHAESVLCREFANAVASHGAPLIVEIFLSRSPCSVSPAITVGGVAYPIGCVGKLITLAGQYPLINQFNIFYDVLYAGSPLHPNPRLRAESSAGVLELNGTARVQAGPLDFAAIVNP
jgi:hypothetical protein